MVKQFIFTLIVFPFFLFSAEFTATVNRTQANMGENIVLTLTLKEANSKGQPMIDPLKKHFSINSQQQMFNSVMINGQITTNTSWKFAMVPQKEGELTIPSISIETSQGVLATQPINIQVAKGKNVANIEEGSQTNDVILTTEISNAKPYKNEPFIYIVRIVSKKDLADIKMNKPEIENAIVEVNGDPRVFHKAVDGVNVGVIEFEYLITPVKSGTIKIAPALVQGVMIDKKTRKGSFFDDDFDPFSMMQGYDRLKPFSLATEELILEIQPPVAGMIPWLPAKSIKIEEVWDEGQSIQAGEPFIRAFKIDAEGVKSTQLPNLNDRQANSSDFKIYADKPELGDEGKGLDIRSFRKEQYTLIPQQAGMLTLPELSIEWWDVAKKEKRISKVPARTLNVLPAAVTSANIASAEKQSQQVIQAPVVTQRDPLLYGLIAGLAMLLLIAMIWVIALQKKISGFTAKPVIKKEIKPKKSDKREKLPDLNPT